MIGRCVCGCWNSCWWWTAKANISTDCHRGRRTSLVGPTTSTNNASGIRRLRKWAGCSTSHGRPHIGANGVSRPPWKMDEKLKSENMQHAKKSSFLYLWYILRAIRAGRCRERRYADHIFIQIHFRMHHFVVKFSKLSSPQAARGHWHPLTKILWTFLLLVYHHLVVFYLS